MKDKIDGYKELTSAQISIINELKSLEERALAIIDCLERETLESIRPFAFLSHSYTLEPNCHRCADPRWVSIGKSHLEQAFMALTRSVARPINEGRRLYPWERDRTRG